MLALLSFVVLAVVGVTEGVLTQVCGQGCTYTIGYWKNHIEDWPVTTLPIGNKVLNQAELLALLNTEPEGDASIILARQLIGALLNKENGASTSEITSTIAQAQTYLTTYSVGSDPAEPGRQTAITLAGTLDYFNNGIIGPGHCDSNPPPACNDYDACTTDTCVGGRCVYTAIANCRCLPSNCIDNDPCTLDECGLDNRCKHTEIPGCRRCSKDIDCSDNDQCTSDKCYQGTCSSSPIPCCRVQCNDFNSCTFDTCQNNMCIFTPLHTLPGCCRCGSDCSDNNPCTTDTCGTDSRCQNTPIAGCKRCTADLDCNGGNALSRDHCVNGVCRYV